MLRKSILKRFMIASIITACLSTTYFAAEAAPPKKGYYPNPSQQLSRQNNRQATQRPRPSSPRPTMQQPRHNSPCPTMQQARNGNPLPMVKQTRQDSPRPMVQQQRTSSPRPVVQQQRQRSSSSTRQQPRHTSTQQTTQQNKRWKPKYIKTSHEKPRLKVQEPKRTVAEPVVQEPKRTVAKPIVHEPKHSVAKPVIHEQKRSVAKPVKHEPKHSVAKPVEHKAKRVEHRKPGPRKDLHRPPVKRTYKNKHVWRRAPKPPKDYWWHHRPAHRPGRYRGYYHGVYYTDVLSVLLAAEIIHSSYDTHYTTVINQADVSDYVFIPIEAIKYKGHHYLVFSDIGKSMKDAQQFCESMGGHLATVGDDDKNERLFRLINDSGYDNESFEKEGYDRFIPNEPVTYEKVVSDNNSDEELYYGLYYWNYKNLKEDGSIAGTGGNAFVCEWDR